MSSSLYYQLPRTYYQVGDTLFIGTTANWFKVILSNLQLTSLVYFTARQCLRRYEYISDRSRIHSPIGKHTVIACVRVSNFSAGNNPTGNNYSTVQQLY